VHGSPLAATQAFLCVHPGFVPSKRWVLASVDNEGAVCPDD
jgi:hypothetical protein